MKYNHDIHYCKFCDCTFRIKIHELETGDFFIKCPRCDKNHYRYFENGVAIHCEINKRKDDNILTIEGQ